MGGWVPEKTVGTTAGGCICCAPWPRIERAVDFSPSSAAASEVKIVFHKEEYSILQLSCSSLAADLMEMKSGHTLELCG